MSVPMTLSDLEMRDARGHIFRRISLISLIPFDLERRIRQDVTLLGEMRILLSSYLLKSFRIAGASFCRSDAFFVVQPTVSKH